MNILIAGATGFIGSALVSFLKGRGHVLTALVRDVNRAPEQLGTGVKFISFGNPDRELITEFENSEVVLNLVGRPLAPSRWSKAKKKEFFDSRVGVTKNCVNHEGMQKPSGYSSVGQCCWLLRRPIWRRNYRDL